MTKPSRHHREKRGAVVLKTGYLLHADFSVSSSGETYCAVPTNELALAKKWGGKKEKVTLENVILGPPTTLWPSCVSFRVSTSN